MKPSRTNISQSGLPGFTHSTWRVPCSFCQKGYIDKLIYSPVLGHVHRPVKCTECQGRGWKEYEKLEYPSGQQARNAQRWEPQE